MNTRDACAARIKDQKPLPIDFQGVGSQGWDVYDVLQERGSARVRIMQRSDGLIAAALFSVKDSPVSLGP